MVSRIICYSPRNCQMFDQHSLNSVVYNNYFHFNLTYVPQSMTESQKEMHNPLSFVSCNSDIQVIQTQENGSSALTKEDLDRSMNTLASSSENIKDLSHKMSLMAFLREFNALTTPMIRTLFKKLVLAVSKLHLQESYHGDLSLENIFLDHEYNIVLGQNVRVSESFLDGVCVDLICLGEILFALCFRSLPYTSIDDKRYIAIVNRDWEFFWAINEKALKIDKKRQNLSKSGLKDLISTLLAGQAQSKYDLFQLFTHEWMKEVTLTSTQVQSLLHEVRKKMRKIT